RPEGRNGLCSVSQDRSITGACSVLEETCSSPPRADAARNRKQLLEVATRVFAAADAEPSLREIARAAGVGIATLYRHFPNREALVAAVYADQVVRLTEGASELLA